MPFNLLLLPLLGGYIFLRYWNPTRYHALRAEKERLIILAAIPGFISLVLAFVIVRAWQNMFPCNPSGLCYQTWWAETIPFDYVGTAMLALVLAGLTWIPLNRLPACKRKAAIFRMISQDAVALDMLLVDAQSRAKTVAVTMSNGKVYVGFVLNVFNPAFPIRFIAILPTKSGYRKEPTKEFKFTNFYSRALDDIEKDYTAKKDEYDQAEEELEILKEADPKPSPEESRSLEVGIKKLKDQLENLNVKSGEFGIVLPVAEIHAVNIFSEYIYQQYFARPAAPAPPAPN